MDDELIPTGEQLPSAKELALPGALVRYFGSQPEPPGGFKSTMAFAEHRAREKMRFNAELALPLSTFTPFYDPAKAGALSKTMRELATPQPSGEEPPLLIQKLEEAPFCPECDRTREEGLCGACENTLFQKPEKSNGDV